MKDIWIIRVVSISTNNLQIQQTRQISIGSDKCKSSNNSPFVFVNMIDETETEPICKYTVKVKGAEYVIIYINRLQMYMHKTN